MQTYNWDDLRLCLSVARAGSLTLAAKRLGLDHSTLARRMNSLEKSFGVALMVRSPKGIELTEAGKALVDHIERMEAEAILASGDIFGKDTALRGTVRLATPEAFGTFIIAPHIGSLLSLHPGIELELAAQTRAFSLINREADLSVTLARPREGRLVAQKLTDYQLGFYASQSYLANHPPIHTSADLKDHSIIWYIDDLIDFPELRSLDQVIAGAKTVFRSSSIMAQQNAVASGAGLGLLHHFAARQDPRLVAVLPEEIRIERSYWLCVAQDQQKLPRLQAVSEFIKARIKASRALFQIA